MVEAPASLFGGGGDAQPTGAAPEDAADPEAERDVVERDDVLVLRRDKPIRTIGEAMTHINSLMDQQITLAVERGAKPNESISGDAPARNTFYTLLPDPQQRTVFLRLAGQMRAWPRLRPLFGAPPYGFLRPEDGGVMRAAGIAAHRQNMTHEEFQSAASYSQFGAGQLLDELAREYRVIRRQNVYDDDPLPCNFEVRDKPDMLLQVRIRRRSRAKRMEMMQDATLRQTLAFPRAGERIILKETKRILALQGKRPDNATRTTLLVKRMVPRGNGASTAALICVMS